MRSRIAVFEGYSSPFGRPSTGRYAGQIVRNPREMKLTAAQIMRANSTRPSPLSDYGRRSYYVPPERFIGPLLKGKRRPAVRKGYKVRRMKDTPAMKRSQNRMKKAAKLCSRKTAKRGSYKACMRRELKSKSKR